MPYPFKQIFAVDPNNLDMVAADSEVLIFAPGDVSRIPLPITDLTGVPLSNPITTNEHGFGPAFIASLPQVAWEGGGFSNTMESYEGLRDEAIAAADTARAAQASADLSAESAATAASTAVAQVTTELSGALTAVQQAAAEAAAAAQLVGAPADEAIAAALGSADSQARAALHPVFVRKGELVTNVADYLGAGDGKDAIEAAVAAAPAGGTVFLPAGVYYSEAPEWVEITKPLTLLGENGTVIKGIRFYIHGTAEELKPITANAAAGDKSVAVAGHGWAAGDYIQTLSEYNVYSKDAGDFQMGSINPTTGQTWTCRASEIHKVASVETSAVRVLDTLRYPYGPSVAGLTQPISGVTSAQARRLNMLDGFTFKNIRFDMSDISGTTPILFRFVARPSFEGCEWDCTGPIGGYIQTTDVYDFQFRNSVMRHPLTGIPSGSGQNAILIGAGSTEVTFEGSSFYGGAQFIDAITNTLFSAGQPGAQGGVIGSDLATVQDVTVKGCRFYDCADAFTSHPATYGVDVLDNVIIGGSQGIHTRSRKTTIKGNTIRTSLTGVSTSAFTDDTVIEGNTIEQLPSPVERPYAWVGVRYAATSAETINGNKVKGYRVRGNTFTASDTTTGHVGVRLYHANPSYAGLTDAIKWALSDIIISGNDFIRCGVQDDAWINGAQILDNNFKGGANKQHYVDVIAEAGRPTIAGNIFHLETATGGFAARPSTGARGYDPAAIIGNNTYIGTGPANVTTALIAGARSAGGPGNSQAGYVNISASADAVGTVKTTTVTFPQPFTAPPVVVATTQAASTVVRHVSNVNATSFQIVAEKVAASGFGASCGWVAVGQIA